MDQSERAYIMQALELRGLRNANQVKWQTISDKTFPEQDKFVQDPSQFIAALCTRRAGKSNGLAIKFVRTMLKFPHSQSRYIALTRDSAKDIMWEVLQEQDEKFKIGSIFTESNLTMTMPERHGGASLRLFGADMKNFVKRLKGVKSPGVAIDESQDFSDHLEHLVDDVLTPTISDYTDSWLALVGTPGPIPHGFFYDITEKGRDGYSVHKWSLFSNPYFPSPREFVAKLKLKKQWEDDNPTFLREWCGQWVLDMDALVFKYSPSKNSYRELPKVAGDWDYVVGVDLGSNAEGNDKDAIAVIGWHPNVKEAYLVEEILDIDEGMSDLISRLEKVVDKYNPLKIVMDTGGLGKKIAEEIQRRSSLPITAADKIRKFEYIELLNDAMRMGRFYAKADSKFAIDCSRLKWDQESTKLKVSDNYHSDILDAALYAFRESLHWLSEVIVEGPKEGTREYYDAMALELERAAEERLEKEQSLEPWENYYGT